MKKDIKKEKKDASLDICDITFIDGNMKRTEYHNDLT
jgi:hypothetical protein